MKRFLKNGGVKESVLLSIEEEQIEGEKTLSKESEQFRERLTPT